MTDHSFPSGHVTGTGALIGIVVLLVAMQHNVTVKRLLMLVAVIVTVVVALTRLYLGVHWLTDVVAGGILATLAVTIGGTAFRTLHNHSHTENNADTHSKDSTLV